jgi:hypothetical protein
MKCSAAFSECVSKFPERSLHFPSDLSSSTTSASYLLHVSLIALNFGAEMALLNIICRLRKEGKPDPSIAMF